MKYATVFSEGGEIREIRSLSSPRNIVSLQVLSGYFTLFTLHGQLVAQQDLLRVEESCCEN